MDEKTQNILLESEKASLLPKNLSELLDDILVFGKQLNRRPVDHRQGPLWYSEVLLNNRQKKDYDKAEKKLRKAFERLEKYWSNKNGIAP